MLGLHDIITKQGQKHEVFVIHTIAAEKSEKPSQKQLKLYILGIT